MSILNNDGIVFHDRANGGWYCNGCQQYIHPDLRHNHKHRGVIGLAAPIPLASKDIANPQSQALKEDK